MNLQPAAHVETEIKLFVSSAAMGRQLLGDAGFTVHVERVFERNLVLDDAVMTLRNSQRLLRVRQAGDTITCTFKGPELGAGIHKQREEREFRASNLDAVLAVFSGLEFAERFRYEKYRTEYVQQDQGGMATLDETPIGCYLELEGPSHWIDRTAQLLGFSPSDYITLSYAKLYLQWCAANGVEPSNLTFEAN